MIHCNGYLSIESVTGGELKAFASPAEDCFGAFVTSAQRMHVYPASLPYLRGIPTGTRHDLPRRRDGRSPHVSTMAQR